MTNNKFELEPVVAENAVVSAEDMASASALAGLTDTKLDMFCSIQYDGTRASKIAMYNAINGDADSLRDHVGEEIALVDVVAHTVQMTDEQTGELRDCARVVLVAADGKCYQAVSEGIMSSLTKLFAICGMPSWKDEPVIVKPKELTTRKGYRVMTLEMIG